MEKIPISAKCITYGRVSFLEESVESFLRQKYDGEKELVIVNDYPEQKLVFDHPNVRIFNLDKPFDTIGEKENFAVKQCRFDTIAVWDDDDIALPWHLENINTWFPGYGLLHWKRGIFQMNHKIVAVKSIGNSGIVYSKEWWRKVGKHEPENAGYDTTFVMKLHKHQVKVSRAEPSMPSWIYNWGNGSYHMSGQGSDKGREESEHVTHRHQKHIENLKNQGLIPIGKVMINPHWHHNYIQNLKEFMSLGQ